jgi:hypothetical protein
MLKTLEKISGEEQDMMGMSLDEADAILASAEVDEPVFAA